MPSSVNNLLPRNSSVVRFTRTSGLSPDTISILFAVKKSYKLSLNFLFIFKKYFLTYTFSRSRLNMHEDFFAWKFAFARRVIFASE